MHALTHCYSHPKETGLHLNPKSVSLKVQLLKIIHLDTNLNLIFDGALKTPSFEGGGGVEFAPPPIFICENNRKSNKIMHCVDLFLF